jgi:hypothetical protein
MGGSADGAAPRVVADLLADRRWGPLAYLIGGYRGRLYLLAIERPTSGPAPGPTGPPALCAVDPREGRVERLCRLPQQTSAGAFDGPYYYFTAAEERENWLDWSPQGLIPRRVNVLYRYRLPG